MKIYLNEQYKCVKVEDNTFVANSTSNFVRYYFVRNADGTVVDEITAQTEVYLNQEPSYVTLGFRRADGNTIQHLMATPKVENDEPFWEYIITDADGVLYKKGALEVSAQFINATLNSENKIISQKVMAVAINTAHILDNIGEEAEEYYSQYEQANNEAHAELQAQITEKFNNIGVMGSLTTDNKNTLVEAINEVDEHADKAQNDVNKLSDDIGDKLSLTTDEKNTIVGAINEVDEHADTAQTTADSAIQTANNAKTVADTAKSIADSASQTANAAKTTANNASATANAIAGTANEAKTIAEQAKTIATNSVYSVSFEDIQSAVTALNGYDNAYFKVGNSIYLKQKDVPDMWVYAVASEYIEYTYTTDDDFVNALLLGTVQVGYYVLANLESTGDYDVLKDIPIINQDLSADGFTPVENTYYRHTGTTSATYTAGVVYFYNGTAYKAIDGAGGETPTALPQEASALKSGNLPTSGWNTSASKELFYGNLNFAGSSSPATDNGKILPPYNYTSKTSTYDWTGTQIREKDIAYCVQKTDGDGKKYISLYFESGYGVNSHKEAEIQIYDDGTVKAWHYSNGAYAETVKIVSTFLSDYIYTISDTSITANSDVLMELTDEGGVKANALASGSITVIRDTVPTQPIPFTYKVKQTNASGQFTLVNHFVPSIPESPTSLPVTYKKASGNLPTTGWNTLDEGWKGSTLPASADWRRVTYGNGKFVAVTDGTGHCAYSTDGISWNETSLPISGRWFGVTYGDGKFVAVALSTDKGAYSTDGITWTTMTLPASQGWHSVTYGNGKFVAVADSSTGAYSTDGITWSTMTLPASQGWYGVTYGDGKFVAVAANSNKGAYSTDGITWTEMSMPKSAAWFSVVYGNDKFVAITQGLTIAAYSLNGTAWSKITLPISASEGIAYGDGKFVTIESNSNKGAYSTDGINWTTMTMPTSQSWRYVTYGDGKFVAVAQSANGAYWKAAAQVTYSISDTSITANSSVKMYLKDEGGVKAQSKASGSITVIRDEVPTSAIPYEYEVEQTSAEGLFEVINNYVPTKTSELTNDSGFITAENIPSATILYDDSTGAATVTLSETINNGDIVRIKTNNGNVDHYYIGVAWNRAITVTESFMVTDENDVTVGTAINIDSLRFNIQDTSLILFHYFNTNITTAGAVTITNEKANVVIRKVERIHT